MNWGCFDDDTEEDVSLGHFLPWGVGMKAKEVLFVSRPVGPIVAENFAIRETTLPDGAPEGHVLLRTLYLSVDPYMRPKMTELKSYTAPYELGKPLTAFSLLEVVDSKVSGMEKGQWLQGEAPWATYFVLNAKEAGALFPADKTLPPELQMGPMGLTGNTAWYGLLEIGKAKAGETVLVSGAAGATGSVAGQIAKAHGCRVVGTAGSDDKVAWLKQELGFDDAFNYKKCHGMAELADAIHKACPDGVDVYFDNVGGEMLEGALENMRMYGRIVMCGGISQYNATPETVRGIRNLFKTIAFRLRLEGFIVLDLFQQPEKHKVAMEELKHLCDTGAIRYRTTIVAGLENAPQALMNLFVGVNTGKMLVKVAE